MVLSILVSILNPNHMYLPLLLTMYCIVLYTNKLCTTIRASLLPFQSLTQNHTYVISTTNIGLILLSKICTESETSTEQYCTRYKVSLPGIVCAWCKMVLLAISIIIPCLMLYYIASVLVLLFFWCPCMTINVSVWYNGGLLPNIILLTQRIELTTSALLLAGV